MKFFGNIFRPLAAKKKPAGGPPGKEVEPVAQGGEASVAPFIHPPNLDTGQQLIADQLRGRNLDNPDEAISGLAGEKSLGSSTAHSDAAGIIGSSGDMEGKPEGAHAGAPVEAKSNLSPAEQQLAEFRTNLEEYPWIGRGDFGGSIDFGGGKGEDQRKNTADKIVRKFAKSRVDAILDDPQMSVQDKRNKIETLMRHISYGARKATDPFNKPEEIVENWEKVAMSDRTTPEDVALQLQGYAAVAAVRGFTNATDALALMGRVNGTSSEQALTEQLPVINWMKSDNSELNAPTGVLMGGKPVRPLDDGMERYGFVWDDQVKTYASTTRLREQAKNSTASARGGTEVTGEAQQQSQEERLLTELSAEVQNESWLTKAYQGTESRIFGDGESGARLHDNAEQLIRMVAQAKIDKVLADSTLTITERKHKVQSLLADLSFGASQTTPVGSKYPSRSPSESIVDAMQKEHEDPERIVSMLEGYFAAAAAKHQSPAALALAEVGRIRHITSEQALESYLPILNKLHVEQPELIGATPGNHYPGIKLKGLDYGMLARGFRWDEHGGAYVSVPGFR